MDASISHGIHATYLIKTDTGNSWTLEMDDGRFSVNGQVENPDCTLRGEEEELVRILRGDQDLLTAMLQGRVELSGNIHLAQTLVALLRSRKH